MGHPWGVHGASMGYLWDMHGVSIGYLWGLQGVSMGHPWGTSMGYVCLWGGGPEPLFLGMSVWYLWGACVLLGSAPWDFYGARLLQWPLGAPQDGAARAPAPLPPPLSSPRRRHPTPRPVRYAAAFPARGTTPLAARFPSCSARRLGRARQGGGRCGSGRAERRGLRHGRGRRR